MAKWVRTSIVLDLKVEDGESFASVISDLTSGMAQGDGSASRLISLEATEVEDAKQIPPFDGRLTFNAPSCSGECPCRNVIG